MKIDFTLYQKILKVFELSKHGIDGEKESAINLLNELLIRYSLTIMYDETGKPYLVNDDDILNNVLEVEQEENYHYFNTDDDNDDLPF